MGYREGYDWAIQQGDAADKRYENVLATRRAKEAGNALDQGDYPAARSVFYRDGDIQSGLAVTNLENAAADRKTAQANAARTRQEADMKGAQDFTVNAYKAARKIPEGPARDAFIAGTVVPYIKSHPILGQGDLADRVAREPHTDQAIDGFLRMSGGYPDDVKHVAGETTTDAITGAVTSSTPEKPNYMTSTDANGNPVILLMNPPGGGGPVLAPGQPGAPGQGAAPSNTPPGALPTGGNYDRMFGTAKANGATPGEMSFLGKLFTKESAAGANTVNPKGPSSKGWFQFHPETFYGVLPNGDITNPDDQTKAALLLTRQDEKALSGAGLPTDDGTLGLAHQQGIGGAMTLLQAPPEINAIEALTPAYGGNRAKARSAIVNNGGTATMTAGEFIAKQRSFYGGQSPGAQPAPQAPAPGGPQVVYQGGKKPDPAEDPPMDDKTVNYWAQAIRAGGDWPPFGMGKGGTANRTRILARVAALGMAEGEDGSSQGGARAEYKANAANLKGLYTQRSQVHNSEGTALKNADIALGLLDKGAGATGSPFLNKPIQEWRRNFAGDPNVSAYDTAIKTFATEYARVMTASPTGAGQLSDSARHEMDSLLDPNATPAQTKATIAVMRRDMASRRATLDQEIAETEARFKGKGKQGGDKYPADVRARLAKDPKVHQATDGSGDLYYVEGGNWYRIDVDDHGPFVTINGKPQDVAP